ncbi:MAG: UDP-N-acetylglucosamine 2-epimerase [Pseudomonadota bacterium]
MNLRRIWVLTTTRADYGLLYWLLREIDEDPELELMLAVSGTHLSMEFGYTVREIECDGFRIHRRMEILLSSDSSIAITKAMGLAMLASGEALEEDNPDLLILLGDRFEIVPVALAAVAHGIPLVHIHGGETTRGAMDEYFRHAVTKLANIHFSATEPYRQRILQMGENPASVFNYGAPGLDHLYRSKSLDRDSLAKALGMTLDRPTAIVTYHPVSGEPQNDAESQINILLEALDSRTDLQLIFTKSNADSRGRSINAHLEKWCLARQERARLFDNMGQRLYYACERHLDLMIGNSSSGLVEAPSFKLPVINVGSRQEGRLTATNVISVDNIISDINHAIDRALSISFREKLVGMHNPYDRFGDGSASRRIKDTLKTISINENLLNKRFNDLTTEGDFGVTKRGQADV